MNNKSFHFLSLTIGISTYANNFGSFLLSWLVYDLTGSKLAMGSLWLIIILGQLIAQFIIGPYLDRWKRKSVMFFSEILRLLIFSSLILMLWMGTENIIYIYLSAFMISIAFFEPAANALIPNLVKENELISANAKVSSIIQITRIVGVLSAGIVGLLGEELSLLIVIILLIMTILLIVSINEDGDRIYNRKSWLVQFRKGFIVYLQKPVLIYLGIFLAISNFSIFAAQTMYLPFVIENLDGSSFEYGFFAASWPVGYIIGTIIIKKLPEYLLNYKLKIMVISLIVGALTFIVLAFAQNIYYAILIELIAGISGPFWNVYSTQIYQTVVPEGIRAQVFSFRILIGRVFAPLGILFGTTVATVWGISNMFVVIGGLSLIIITSVYFLFLRKRIESL